MVPLGKAYLIIILVFLCIPEGQEKKRKERYLIFMANHEGTGKVFSHGLSNTVAGKSGLVSVAFTLPTQIDTVFYTMESDSHNGI